MILRTADQVRADQAAARLVPYQKYIDEAVVAISQCEPHVKSCCIMIPDYLVYKATSDMDPLKEVCSFLVQAGYSVRPSPNEMSQRTQSFPLYIYW